MNPSDLVGVSEIAVRAGVKPDTVKKWRGRPLGFPAPFVTLAAGPVWLWPDVEAWLAVPRTPGRPSLS